MTKKYFNGPGTNNLNRIISDNESLFANVIDFNQTFNSDYYSAISIAVNNFVKQDQFKELIISVNNDNYNKKQLEAIFFQEVNSSVAAIIIQFIKDSTDSVEELSSYLYSHLIRWSFTSNAYHFVNGLGKKEQLATYSV